MGKSKLFTLALILSLAVFLSGCFQSGSTFHPDEKLDKDQFDYVRQTISGYLGSGSVVSITPEELYQVYILEKNGDYLLIDIRAREDFINNNIKGSINIPYSQTVTTKTLLNLPQDKTLIVIDYNGHWAAQTAATWNVLGYRAKPLLYGMQSWTVNQAALGFDMFPLEPLNAPLVTTATELGQYDLPELKVPEGTVQDIIRRLTDTYLNRNYRGFMTAEDVLSSIHNENSAYIVDIRQANHYQKGHIQGAVNIPLEQLATTEMLRYLPQDQRIILVGYDGMDASQAVRALITLGYDAVALKYGMSYWHGEQALSGVEPIRQLVQDYYELTPLNYVVPSTGPAGCG